MTDLPDSEIRRRLTALAPSQLSDAMGRLNVVDSGIAPMWPSAGFVGRAVTAYVAPGDNKVLHELVPDLTEGDVVVVNGSGVTNRALLGGIIAERMQRHGAVAVVLDGAIRDALEFEEIGLPAYARAVSPAGPYRNGPGRLHEAVAIGNVVVHPGDWLVGDRDGIAVVPQGEIDEVLAGAEAKRESEEKQLSELRAGLLD
ncbi:RraA family protein [Gulosibacter sediminis]|uniref:RraA family protein n=1 Tax=Gulosibacter sediminis TaxID=1729695 RepID=UPI0024A86BAA|nr:methyltransferase [Gulosibacter sediminis]